MKTKYNAFFLTLALATLASCGDKNDTPSDPNSGNGETPEGAVEVTIATSKIETKANAMLEFGSADKMNVYPKTYGRIDAPNIVDGVVATYDGSKWTMSPKVMIDPVNQKNAFVYAVAPYDASYTDPQNIPVDLDKQIDLLYSGEYKPASVTTPTVNLKMKHALSLLTFNIIPVGGNVSGELTSMKLDGDIIYKTGTMNAGTGKITLGSTGVVNGKYNKNVSSGGWSSDLPGLWVLPFNTKTGTANLTVELGGKTYNLVLPEVEVKTGWQYIFRLVLTEYGLEFDPSKTETRSLNEDSDEDQSFEGYGRLTLTSSGTWMYVPSISGDAIFGTICTPAKSLPYSQGLKLEGLSMGDKVVVESWNSTGFTLESLEGIDAIDISLYE